MSYCFKTVYHINVTSLFRLIFKKMTVNIENLRYAYDKKGTDTLLDIPRWTIAKGEKVLLYGPSGAGKSTLLNLISGILRSSEGKLEVMGKRLDKMNERERDRFRANNVGYVFQSFNLFPFLNAYENVDLSLYFSKDARSKRSKQEIENLLRELNLSKSDCAKPIRQLSIGQQQRVAIARSLIKKPGLLIADEPTSSLDEENRNQFMSVLLDLINEQNTTLLFVSHDLSLRQHFNRVEALAGIHKEKII